jgi:hypothetical protein
MCSKVADVKKNYALFVVGIKIVENIKFKFGKINPDRRMVGAYV